MDISQTLNTLIRERRSSFPAQYTGEKVADNIIHQMLENATWAPNHGKTEPWKFFVFTGKGLENFAKAQAEAYKNRTPTENFDENKYQKFYENPMKASHVIAICMQRQETEKIPEIEEISAVACAVQNMYLTATAYDVGAYWNTGGFTYWQEGKDLLGLGQKDKLMGFFYVGVLAKNSPDSTRKPISQKMEWIDE